MAENAYLNWSNHSSILISKLYNMLEREVFTDLTLSTAEGLSIKVHRSVLCTFSSYLEDLLSQYPAHKHITIILCGVSFQHLKMLVEFIYKGKVAVTHDQLPALMETALSLKIKGLVCDEDEVLKNYEEYAQTSEDLVLPEQKDDEESQQYNDPTEYLSQHSSLDGFDSSDDLSDEGLSPNRSTDVGTSQSNSSALEPPSDNVQPITSSEMNQHSNNLGSRAEDSNRPFKCSKCGRAYFHRKNMRSHFLHDCGFEPRFQCPQCDYRSHRKQSLQKHLIGIHKVEPSQLEAVGFGSNKVRTICQRAFQHKRNLDLHLINEFKVAQDLELAANGSGEPNNGK